MILYYLCKVNLIKIVNIMKIKIDTISKEIIICEKVSLDELSLFLTGLKDMMNLDEFSVSF